MKRIRFGLLVAVLLSGVGGCQDSKSAEVAAAEKVLKEQIEVFKEVQEILRSVKDEDSVHAAIGKLDQKKMQMERLNQQLRNRKSSMRLDDYDPSIRVDYRSQFLNVRMSLIETERRLKGSTQSLREIQILVKEILALRMPE